MNYIFIFLSSLLLIYVSTRKIDFFTIGVVVFIIYHFNCVYGSVHIHSREALGFYLYSDYISPSLYLLTFSKMIILFVAMVLYDINSYRHANKLKTEWISKRSLNEKGVYRSFLLLGIISISMFTIDVYRVGLTSLAGDKSEVWDSVGVFYVFTMWSALAIFAYSIKKRKRVLLFFSLPQVLTHLFIGSRAYFAAMLIIFLILYRDQLKSSIAANFKIYFAGGIGFFAIMVYRQIVDYIKIFDFETIKVMLVSRETYMWVLRFGEPRIVLANYNYVLNSGFRLDFSDIFARLISVFPLANRLVDPTHNLEFGRILREQLNASYGLGSTFWGEGYAMFGMVGIFVFFFAWVYILKVGSDVIKSNKVNLYFIIPLVSYFSFYIHRLAFSKVIGNIKYLVFAAIVWWLINAIITNNWIVYTKKEAKTTDV